MPHPVPYGPRSCSRRMVEGRTQFTVPTGEALALILNPQMLFVDAVQNYENDIPAPGDQPDAIPSAYAKVGPAASISSTPTGATAFPMAYQYISVALPGPVSTAPSSSGTGWKRWLGLEVAVREVSTQLNQGGSIYWTDGRTGRSLLGWRALPGAAGGYSTVSRSTFTGINTASAHPLSLDWTHCRAVPSTPEDLIFTDIPERSVFRTSNNGPNFGYDNIVEVLPDVVLEGANDSWRCACVVEPASSGTVQLEVKVTGWYETHWIQPGVSEGSAANRHPQTPDTGVVKVDPQVSALHSNAMSSVNGLLDRGFIPPIRTSNDDGGALFRQAITDGAVAYGAGRLLGAARGAVRRLPTTIAGRLADTFGGLSIGNMEDAAIGAMAMV